MRTTTSFLLLSAAALLGATPALAQEPVQVARNTSAGSDTTAAAPKDTTAPAPAAPAAAVSLARSIEIQHMRPFDQRGLNVFETPKDDDVPFRGFRLDLGAAFAQQFQGLSHESGADEVLVNGVDKNALMEIGKGFNLATANLYVNAQLAPGIRVSLSSYLSSRHHQETWVKDGFLLIDESPIKVAALENLMKYVTIKAGHFELNYGDAHFRRSDNGQALYNPFVGNMIMDAFTTEIGGEVYVRANGLIGMVGVTGGVNKGDVTNPDSRSPAFLGKLGFDRQLTSDLRVRLTGSGYTVSKTPAATLFGGDRAGSRYYMVLENTAATTDKQATSGTINPALSNKLTAFQINPFVKFRGLELFGVIEQAQGRTNAETENRTWNQYDVDVVYRFLPREQLFVGARYNTVDGELRAADPANVFGIYDVTVSRQALSAGWFVTPSVLLKAEYVTQKYNDFPTFDIRNGGKFDGFVVEGAVAF